MSSLASMKQDARSASTVAKPAFAGPRVGDLRRDDPSPPGISASEDQLSALLPCFFGFCVGVAS
jgi:hypothetical protein